jgi:hypothetical protein
MLWISMLVSREDVVSTKGCVTEDWYSAEGPRKE